MSNTKILIVSYLFPPAGGIAVQRALSLAKYLPQCGYEVHVLTAGNAAAAVRDPGLLRRVPAGVRIHKAFSPEIPFVLRHTVWGWLSRRRPKIAAAAERENGVRKSWAARVKSLIRRILCPDPELVWVPFALRKARQIIRKHGIEVLLVTAPPFSTFLAGNALKRRFPHLTYVTDFRDEWLDYFLKDFDYHAGEHARRRAAEMERATIEHADLVVAVAPSSLDTIRNRYPQQPDRKFACISNGYDPDALANFQTRASDPDKMVVTHMGTVYKTASPRFYLDAVDSLPEEMRARIETRFIGRIADAERHILESRKSNVRVLGFMPQDEALRYLEETDYVLLTMTNEISLPGKLYEYLATGKPILALSPATGEVRPVIEQTRSGWCVDPYDPDAIRAMLQAAWERKQGRPGAEANRAEILRYARPCLVEAYARLMREAQAVTVGVRFGAAPAAGYAMRNSWPI